LGSFLCRRGIDIGDDYAPAFTGKEMRDCAALA
jgi:hypothetical protein